MKNAIPLGIKKRSPSQEKNKAIRYNLEEE
jgi:hypothetical protein